MACRSRIPAVRHSCCRRRSWDGLSSGRWACHATASLQSRIDNEEIHDHPSPDPSISDASEGTRAETAWPGTWNACGRATRERWVGAEPGRRSATRRLSPTPSPHLAIRAIRGCRCRCRRRGRDPDAERAGLSLRARSDRAAAPAVGGRGLVAHRGLRRLVAQPRPCPRRSPGRQGQRTDRRRERLGHGGGDRDRRPGGHGRDGRPARDPCHADGERRAGAARAPARGAELDRRAARQPLGRGLRAAARGPRWPAARGPRRVHRAGRPPGRGPGRHRPCPVRDDPPVHRRQRARGPGAHPRDPAATRGGDQASFRRSPSFSPPGPAPMSMASSPSGRGVSPTGWHRSRLLRSELRQRRSSLPTKWPDCRLPGESAPADLGWILRPRASSPFCRRFQCCRHQRPAEPSA